MLVDLVKIFADTVGTGAITLGDAVPGYRGKEALTNGESYSYSIQQDSLWEIGRGTVLGTQLVRSPQHTSNGGEPINLQPNAAIAFVALAVDIAGPMALDIQNAVDNAVLTLVPPTLKSYPIIPYNANDLQDMGPVVQLALNAGVRDFSGVNLYINSAVIIPNNVTITWAPQGEIIPKTEGYFNRTGIWVIGPNAAINWGRTTVLMNPSIVQQDFMTPPVVTGNTTNDTNAAAARLAARSSNGTGMLLNRPDVLVFNPLIVGFNTAIIMNAERIRVIEARIDCYNSIEGYGITDVCYVNDVHIWPYWAAHIASISQAITASYNKGLYFHDQADGVQINGGLIYGMANSEHFSNVYSLKAKGVWIDGDAATNAARGAIGVLTEGNCQFLDISHGHVDSQAYSRKLTHTGGIVIWGDCTSSNAQTADTVLGVGHSRGSVEMQAAKGTALITLNAGIGIHTVKVSASGGTATQVLDASAVTPASLLSRVSIDYTSIGCPSLDNRNVLPSVASATSTFDAAPAIIAPASTPTLTLTGKTTPGDYPELAAYRRVSSQPSHQGYILVNGTYYELMGGHVFPDHFLRTGDTDDAASFLRARDYMIAKNITTKQLGARVYNVSSGQISYAGMPVNMIGQGHSEAGIVNGINANLSNFGQPALGTWIRAGLIANATAAAQSAFVFGNAGSGIGNGAFLDRIGFVQSHPNPVTGWAPTNYDYLINMTNTLGGLTIGDDVMFLGINRGIYCNNSGRLEIHNFKGQFYTEGLYLDQALDSTIIRNTHLWTFNGFSAPVALWSQANAKAFRLFRCDGIDGGVAFILGYNTGIELNSGTSTSPGPPTDIHFDKFWADLTQYGIYNNAVSARVTINDFVGQCEKAYSTGGTALPNSAGYYGTASSGGGLISFGNTRFERFSIAGISNNSSTTIVQTGIARTASHPGAPIYQTTGGNPPISLSNPVGFVDDLSGTFGVNGTDYTAIISDQKFYYSGTTNSSGVASFAHGLGAAAAYGLRGAFAVCKGNSGEALAMSHTVMDGTNCSFVMRDTSQFASRTFRACLTIPLRPSSVPAW
jgi:hypothetical protein